ncbi:MAG: WxcM-like domain-containing protein [Muribaculum sp.]|nr:WxcM-like domain-containing protein [Muribaculum sp.]
MDDVLNSVIVIPRKLISDNRGWFLKTLTGDEEHLKSKVGEIYFTSATPGQVKGKHYHKIANEWFTLIRGKAVLVLEDITTKDRQEIILDCQNPTTVFIPPFVAHAVENRYDEDFILCAYTDEQYDPSDTIPYQI